MSDHLAPLSFDRLLTWSLRELEHHSTLFGLHRSLFFTPSTGDPFRMRRYGHLLETPIGVAAGPHTQLAQNIVASWLMGARYIELKTVQTLDSIDVARPCIDMDREGYNCEWSQELSLEQSAREYAKAWVLIHLLHRHLGFEGAAPGIVFNLSVGYDLAGIRKPNMQRFLDRMMDASDLIDEYLAQAASALPGAPDIPIDRRISDNVTLSTMHGCPPGEIESIARYLIEERGLHTAVKLNPTLLGPEELRSILAERGFGHLDVPDVAFEHDLAYEDGLRLIDSLQASAGEAGVEFGLKLTNTLEVVNRRGVLPPDQEHLYLSSDALHPLAVNLAHRLRTDLGPGLDISFCGGADAFNTPDLLACGLAPVTVCSDLLRPGGYLRLPQYLDELRARMEAVGAASLDTFPEKVDGSGSREDAAAANLEAHARRVRSGVAAVDAASPRIRVKTGRSLPRFDCALAPCVQSCAIEQDIPDYLYWLGKGDEAEAWQAILRANPLPRITGMVCDHLCMTRCVRSHYDDPLLIRELKRFVAERAPEGDLPRPRHANGLRVAVIGAGPSGLAAAWFLALAGCSVEVFDEHDDAGGMAAHAIPAFRLDDQALAADIDRLEAVGVRFCFGERIDRSRFEELRGRCNAVYVAVGAQRARQLGLKGEEAEGVWDQLDFLARVREGTKLDPGRHVIVIGGGNSAVDAARTAARLVAPRGRVTLLYRRTRAEMPADPGEVDALVAEGVELSELAAPVAIDLRDGRLAGLRCMRMTLGATDSSGRPHPEPVPGSDFALEADTVITALGQEVELAFLPEAGFQVDPETLETPWEGVYAGGDAIRGASTLIRAVRDGKRAAERILLREGVPGRHPGERKTRELTLEEVQRRQAKKRPGVGVPESHGPLGFDPVHPSLTPDQAVDEASRCLQCSDVCNICAAVCPNRANVALASTPRSVPTWKAYHKDSAIIVKRSGNLGSNQPWQIVNVPDFCNECGNCVTFCPSAGKPWRDKPRVALSEAAWQSTPGSYRLLDHAIALHLDNGDAFLTVRGRSAEFRHTGVRVQFTWPEMQISTVRLDDGEQVADLRAASEMALLYTLLQDNAAFRSMTENAQ